MRICFVCHGNICRSPAGELIFEKLCEENHFDCTVVSRATHTDEIWNGHGSPVYPPMRKILESNGISCAGKEAELLISSDYEKYDMFIGMDEENRRAMTRIFHGDPEHKVSLLSEYDSTLPDEIEDPWYTRNFQKVYEQIYKGCAGLLTASDF